MESPHLEESAWYVKQKMYFRSIIKKSGFPIDGGDQNA